MTADGANGHGVYAEQRFDADVDAFANRDREPSSSRSVAVLIADAARIETPPIRSYSTGNLPLDNLLGGGLNTRELCVVLGPPGAHKTAWAISTAIHLSRHVPQLYASTELEQHELVARFAANVLGKPWSGIRRGVVDRDAIVAALGGMPIHVIGCESMPRDGDKALAMIEREATRLAERYRVPPAIWIDYLQDLARGSDRELKAKIGDLATHVRVMSQRLDAVTVAVSSVSRTFYSAKKAAALRELDDPTVYLAAAKETGDVDYAAARVIFLDAEDDHDKEERAIRIAVAKSRDARTGFAGARVVAASGRFIVAPDVLGEMAVAGRGVVDTMCEAGADDEAIYLRVVREHAAGKGSLCTQRYLRAGNKLGKKPLGKERAEAALDRLVLAGRLQIAAVTRIEHGKAKSRNVYSPVPAGGAS